MIDRGLPFVPDMFTTGETPHGCGHVMRTIHQGIRSTAADFITKGFRRENITIKTDVTVDKVILSKADDGELTATGVLALSKEGAQVSYKARKEVILSAGAYCSPPILLRSGIGPKSELQKHGIECQVDLPGVGKNLQDHVLCFIFYEVSRPDLTLDAQVYHGTSAASTYKLYKDTKTGLLSTFPFGMFAYSRLSDRLQDSPLWTSAPHPPGRDAMHLSAAQPHAEIWNTELYGGPKQLTDFPTDGQHAFAMCPLLFSQRSRGSVTLKSKDCRENPVVDHKYLDDPLDMLVMSEACRLANEIAVKGKGTRDVVKGSWPPHLKHHTYETREQWEGYVREHGTTCKWHSSLREEFLVANHVAWNRLSCVWYMRHG